MDAFERTNALYWVGESVLSDEFPPLADALAEPDGLLAIGGNLSPERLVDAYRRGIFPWFSEGQPILWWSPAERSVIKPAELHISRSLRKVLRQQRFDVSWDCDFCGVIDGCAAPRESQSGTWITAEMRAAYCELFRRGVAHSIECRVGGELVGGMYGLAIGRAFFGESMFSHIDNASKVAMATLCAQLVQWNYDFLDCQIHNPHLERMGARLWSRQRFEQRLHAAVAAAPAPESWAPRCD